MTYLEPAPVESTTSLRLRWQSGSLVASRHAVRDWHLVAVPTTQLALGPQSSQAGSSIGSTTQSAAVCYGHADARPVASSGMHADSDMTVMQAVPA